MTILLLLSYNVTEPKVKCSVRHGESKIIRDTDTDQDPVELLDRRVSLCLPFLDHRKQASFSLHGLPRAPMGRFKQLLTREVRGCRDKGEAVKKLRCIYALTYICCSLSDFFTFV